MLVRTVSFLAAFVLALVIGRHTTLPETGLALFWPASGVAALWGLLAAHRREVLLVGALVGAVSGMGNALTGLPPATAVWLALANASIAVGCRAVLSWLRHRSGTDAPVNVLTRVDDFYRALLAGMVGTTVSAVFGMVGLAAGGTELTWSALIGWIVRNMAAIVVIAVPGLALRDTAHQVRLARLVEALPVYLVTGAVMWLVFAPGQTLPLAFVPFAAIVWAGLRLPLPLATIQGILVSLEVLVLVSRHRGGPFGAVSDDYHLALVLQGFMAMAVGLAIAIATVQWERSRLLHESAAAARAARAQADDLEVITSTIPDAVMVVGRDGRILLHNEAALQWLPPARDGAVPSLSALDPYRLDGAPFPEAERPTRRALQGERVRGEVLRMEDIQLAEMRTVSVDAVPLNEEVGGPPERVLLVIRDVSEEYARLHALLAERERTERLISDAPHGVAVLDLEGRVVQVNDSLATLFGRPARALVGRLFADLSPTHREPMVRHLARTLEDPGSLLVGDWTIVAPEGSEAHVSLTSRVLETADGVPDVVLVNVVDFSEQRRYEERLSYLADHDPLTGLVNRRRFDAVLDAQLRRRSPYEPDGALLLLDLDHFKEVNDTMGHGVGDELIVGVAGLLDRSLRSSDVVARVGGDEFAIILPDADQAAARRVASSVIESVRDFTRTLDGVRRRVTVSMGVVTFAEAAEQEVDVLALADMLLYDAKEGGRDRFAVLSSTAAKSHTGARLEVKGRIEAALEEDQFELYLQPLLDLRTERVAGAEALLRLVDGGPPLSPDRFVRVAERTGLAVELDCWVVRHAVELLARIHEQVPDFGLGVNLSGRSIGSPVVERTLVDAIRQHRIRGDALVIEATETAAVADVPAARSFAQRLAELGTRVAIDDFGAGFGSFYYLKHLPFDIVKIDGEFVRECHTSAVDRAILASIVGIARDLGKETVAEFVTEQPVLDVVCELGVDYAQGFHIGEPVPFEEFRARHLPGGTSGWRTDVAASSTPEIVP
ncbi:EAL domain-containing protein [Phycicoccus endophyticus]|uniref:EAL domain-containing protein n=1 Tax=Phycicoccus endophyticus TaxID=1690220 RepID=A0A7G9R281_9MICO|nr:EAL domain-containing protein [Phycicoccus endophyticus]NHI19639.1 EAL domain-containing protein [Phycicoccus endophyticus]QNN49706.1 EAL domain-containing protein [Phycicoccus endophyticus]GGL34306.1 diguanylate cyclase [Phycicoccus endophyticus]